ncbi:hypothetical protein [Hyphomicrobium sp. 99]|uniref:hypothetical protein n=1 Tax=Hyphomicrobium sp. 99 TaxID=1163419 RepID=UPI0005F822D7|nr:hypothetical protein [Hyphomicrobium sp. 99]
MKFPQGSYSDEQFAVIQTAFENVCTELGIGETETKLREYVAQTFMALTKDGQYDPERLKTHAISRLQKLDIRPVKFCGEVMARPDDEQFPFLAIIRTSAGKLVAVQSAQSEEHAQVLVHELIVVIEGAASKARRDQAH